MAQDPSTPNGITLASCVSAKQTVFSTSVDDDLILFDPESGSYYGAGAVGQKIWELVAGECAVEAICNKLLEEFEIDRQTCEDDVVSFLNDLHAKGLIQVKAS